MGIEQGLSQATVHSLFQDRDGFLWVGTQDGLNRWDGREFVQYRANPKQPTTTPSDSRIRAITQDSKGRLWLGNDAGTIDRLHARSGRFTPLPVTPSELGCGQIRAFYWQSDRELWIAGTDGLRRIDIEDEELGPLHPESIRFLTGRHSTLFLVTVEGRVMRLFEGGEPEPVEVPELEGTHPHSILIAPDDTIWIGRAGGVTHLSSDWQVLAAYELPAGGPNRQFIKDLLIDHKGRLWAAGSSGLFMSELGTEPAEFHAYRSDSSDPNSLTNDEILHLLQDRSGLIWFGTATGGLNRTHPASVSFGNYSLQQAFKNPTTFSFAETTDGSLWVGTASGLLRRPPGGDLELTTGPATDDGSISLSSDLAMSLLGDRAGNLWIGTRVSGVLRVALGTGKLSHFKADENDPTALSFPSVMDIFESSAGHLLFGTAGGGLNLFEPESESFRHFFNGEDGAPPDFISDIAETTPGHFWLAMYRNGLVHFRIDDGSSQRFSGRDGTGSPLPTHATLPTNAVSTVLPTADGRLWLGSLGSGLILFEADLENPESATYRTWDESRGLANNTIYAARSDSEGMLWLSTARGLSRFDPEAETFTNFEPRHGLQAWEFTLGASMVAGSGELLFGGVHGFNQIRTEAIMRSLSPPPPVVLVGLQINNEARPLPEVGQGLELSYRDTSFQLEMAALDYRAPEANRYAYKLEGFNPDWIEISQSLPAAYTNLDPGNYVFRAKAANSDGIWNEEGISLPIYVERAPWDRWWAWTLYVLLGSALIFGGVRWRLSALQRRSIELKKQVDQRTLELSDTVAQLKESETVALEAKRRAVKSLEEALEERRRAQEADQAKSVFLSSMSHELRTPLNAVLGFAQLMERDPRLIPEHRDSLKVILRSGEHLLSLINDVLSLAKIEAGRLSLRSEPFLLLDLCHDVEEMVRTQAEEKGLELRLERGDGLPVATVGDSGRLMQVLLNLMGNAVKFTHRGSVSLALQAKGPLVEFAIRDTGVGIHADELHKLFEPFQQTAAGRESREGTGLGLAISERLVDLMGGVLRVDSEPGRGTTFTFALPLEACDPSRVASDYKKVVGLHLETKPPKILIADDTVENRSLLERLFTEVGFPVRTAADGEEAVAMWREWRPSLIWMDMRMPVMDGFEATRSIRREEEKLVTGRTVIVALTAAAFEDDQRDILEAGCDAVVTKPYQERVLFETMASFLGLTFVHEESPAPADDDDVDADPSSDDITQEILNPFLSKASDVAEAKVLIAEDNPSNQMVARRMLERLGYEAKVVGNGALALEALEATPYPLVFMDIRMPRMDGFEAARRIRGSLKAEQQPIIIALTGLASEEERRMCLQAGMNDLLAKPFRIEELKDMLGKWAPASLKEAQKKPSAKRPKSAESRGRSSVSEHTLNRQKLDLLEELDDGTGTHPLSVQVISLFLETVPGQLRELQRAINDQDRRRWRSVTHSLKNSSSTLGAEHLSRLCKQLEKLAEKEDVDGDLFAEAVTLYSELEGEAEAALEALRREKAQSSQAFQGRRAVKPS